MEKLEILQEKHKDLQKEYKQLHRDYLLAIKEISTLRRENTKLRDLLKPRQQKEFELDQLLNGQLQLPLGGK